MDNTQAHIAYITEREQVTYAELYAQAEQLCSEIKERSLVFIVAANNPESLLAYAGFMKKGIVALMLPSTIETCAFSSLLESYQPEYVWCPQSFSYNAEVLCNHGSYQLLKTHFENQAPLHPDLALLLSTSGSTGSHKFVRLSKQNIETNARSIIEYLGITQVDRAITTLPFSYSYGLSIINSHLLAGASLILTDKGLFDRDFWDLLKKYNATSFGGVPYTYSMLKRLRFERMDLPSLRYITQAGGRLGEDLHKEFADICANLGIDFYVMYGQTEATARMSYLSPEKASEKAGSIGQAIPGGAFSLQDKEGNFISRPHVSGELVYKGANVSMGYAKDRKDLSKGASRDSLLKTGDMAFFDEDGYYFIIGRRKRFLKIYGNRVNLDEIDAFLQREGMIAACSGQDDNLVIFLEQGDSKEALRLVTELTSLNKSAIKIKELRALPRNEAGKLLYSSLENLC